MANWLGQPSDPDYKEKEQIYLELEREVVSEAMELLGPDGWNLKQNIVVDTTGSVIYLGDKIMEGLKQRSRMVYLAIPDAELEFMIEQYFSDPKPVIWGDAFQPKESETTEESLKRCYPELIHWRAERYRSYADMMLIMDRDHRDRMSVTRFLQLAGAR